MADCATDPVGDLLLEPLAARLRWQLPVGLRMSEWVELLRAYLDTLAARSTAAGPYVIGHIKALATLPAGGYLRGSSVSPAHPADVAAEGAWPADCAELDMTLNLIVYGLPFELARSIATRSAEEVALARGGTVLLEVFSERSYPAQHHPAHDCADDHAEAHVQHGAAARSVERR
jgi:hypothetical protein